MRATIFISYFIIAQAFALVGQNLYFPPSSNTLSDWETTDPAALGWCVSELDSLYALLETGKTKGFVLLKDGKIVLEKYFAGHDASKNWQWNSAGKTLTAVAVGLAEQENLLALSDPTSQYLGQNWTSCSAAAENAITIRHQLTMTTGLDDGVADVYCTDAACLTCLAPAGTRWAYHNAPYTLLDSVVLAASGQNLNIFLQNRLKTPIGMNGFFLKIGFNNIYFSTTRSMARFGLFLQAKGKWNNQDILTNTDFLEKMKQPSQTLNPAYGYLTWLNGSNTFMLPSSQFIFQGRITPSAPADMYSALGKDGQYMQVVPSLGLVLVRMGESPDGAAVPILFAEQIWKQLNNVMCTSNLSELADNTAVTIEVFPNPNTGNFTLHAASASTDFYFKLYDSKGKLLKKGNFRGNIDVNASEKGLCFLKIQNKDGAVQWKKISIQ